MQIAGRAGILARLLPSDIRMARSMLSPRPERQTRLRLAGPPPRRARTALLVAAGLMVLVMVSLIFIDEPLRRSMESRINRSLEGYSVRIERLRFNPISLSLTLENLVLRQSANPEPAVLEIPRLQASVQWKELFALRLVADFVIDRPRVYWNLRQLRSEASDPRPVEERGWQKAIEEIYPLKINRLRVRDASVTYVDSDPDRPLKLTDLDMEAENIRNIHSRDRVYPSPIRATARIFETGRGSIDGHADFLAEPFPGVHAVLKLEGVPLESFRPVVARSNLALKGGILSLAGRVEYGPRIQGVDLADLTIRGMKIDYVHSAPTAAAEARRAEQVSQAARKVAQDPRSALRVARLRLLDSELGFVNRARDPGYRVFLSHADLEMNNYSNRFRSGEASLSLSGSFMGAGPARASAKLRPEAAAGPDFDLDVAIEDTPVTALNDLFRSYGKFDVAAGVFTFYSELAVSKRRIDGYVKPLFRDLKVYDRRQEAEKSLFRKLYEKIVGGVADLLENQEREEVATRADVSGPVGNPDTSTLQIIGRLIENAFFRAILPGFEEEAGRRGR